MFAMNKSEIHPAQALLISARKSFSEQEDFQRLCNMLQPKGSQAYCGQSIGSSHALLIAELARHFRKPLVAVVPDQSSAYLLLDDLEFFFTTVNNPPPVFVFPHLEILPYEPQAPELTIRMERLAPLQYMIESSRAPEGQTPPPPIVIAPIFAALKRMPPLRVYEQQALRCVKGGTLSRDRIREWLVAQGYEFRDLVAQRGDFSVRGDIVDIYSYSYPEPVRIEFWGDEVDSIRLFHVSDQRSVKTIEDVVIYPGQEDNLVLEALTSGLALEPLPLLFGEDTLVVTVNSDEVEKQGQEFYSLVEKRYKEATSLSEEDHEVHLGEEEYHKRQDVVLEPPEVLYLTLSEWGASLKPLRQARLTEFTLEPGEGHLNLGFASTDIYGEEQKERLGHLLEAAQAGRRILIVCDNTGQQNRMEEILAAHRKEKGIQTDSQNLLTLTGGLHRGFVLLVSNLLICTDREIFGRYRRFSTPVRDGIALPVTDLVDLQPGDYVVHIDHGIGRFVRMTRMTHDGHESEFLHIEYAEGGMLYVPIEQIDRVGRYIGGDNAQPALAKLGTKNWERTKARARQAIEDMAEELLELYATRASRKGHAFSPDTPWQHEFEASFLYEETADQWRAIEEVKRDMEHPEPMDRLICGDVGFGKTEVAIRAAFKAVMDGKQVAVLVPTTILCQQHYNTFCDRLADYPVRVEMLSRFRTPADQKQVIEDLARGEIDIIIGTHRLLSQDVRLNDLGLVIIDEEQRFGVKHKERLRQLRKLVDTLTLTATPIPRTLYMSLSGIRNMSLVSTPPKNRLPIETYIMEWSKEVIENAILRELSRDGQVYFVHNRVESIYKLAHYVQELVPQARVCVGHGQMSERDLEEVMLRFIRHDYDILVATTIIENGIDIPNVNTIIINNAGHFGLSQLYQLRGRVGRDRHRAYCYLIVPSKKALSAVARRRLLALQQHNQLGAGFHLAMRDMEIRGIGNILGRQQHGHIAAIGFDLYSKLLRDTVSHLKGNKLNLLDWDTALEMANKGNIPPTYVESSKQRMSLHQRIGKIKTNEEIDSFEAELKDIYGTPPPPVQDLLAALRIRVRAHQAGFDLVQVKANSGLLRYHSTQSERFNPLRVLELDGWNGLKFLVTTQGENVQIEFQDMLKKGIMAERIIPLIDALEQEEAPRFEKPALPSLVPLEKTHKKGKTIRRIFR